MGRLREPLLRGAGNPVIHLICGYELIALHSRLPAISELFKLVRRNHPYVAVGLLLFWVGILTHHLLIEPLEAIVQ